MKKILKGYLIYLIISVLFGFVSAKLVYNLYNNELENRLSSSKLYLIEKGKYLTYDNMREENNSNNYIYYKDEDGYKTVIGITKDYNNIDKIKSLYTETMNVEEYYISQDLLNEKQYEYDLLLNKANDIHEVKEVVNNILNLYRNDDTIKLVLTK